MAAQDRQRTISKVPSINDVTLFGLVDALSVREGYPMSKWLDEQTTRTVNGIRKVLEEADPAVKEMFFYRYYPTARPKLMWTPRLPIVGYDRKGKMMLEDSVSAYMLPKFGSENRLRLVAMSPERFLSLAAGRHMVEEGASESSRKVIDSLKKSMLEGRPVDTPFLDIDLKTNRIMRHEGRHRAKAAQELGIDLIPVWITAEDDEPQSPLEEARFRNFDPLPER